MFKPESAGALGLFSGIGTRQVESARSIDPQKFREAMEQVGTDPSLRSGDRVPADPAVELPPLEVNAPSTETVETTSEQGTEPKPDTPLANGEEPPPTAEPPVRELGPAAEADQLPVVEVPVDIVDEDEVNETVEEVEPIAVLPTVETRAPEESGETTPVGDGAEATVTTPVAPEATVVTAPEIPVGTTEEPEEGAEDTEGEIAEDVGAELAAGPAPAPSDQAEVPVAPTPSPTVIGSTLASDVPAAEIADVPISQTAAPRAEPTSGVTHPPAASAEQPTVATTSTAGATEAAATQPAPAFPEPLRAAPTEEPTPSTTPNPADSTAAPSADMAVEAGAPTTENLNPQVARTATDAQPIASEGEATATETAAQPTTAPRVATVEQTPPQATAAPTPQVRSEGAESAPPSTGNEGTIEVALQQGEKATPAPATPVRVETTRTVARDATTPPEARPLPEPEGVVKPNVETRSTEPTVELPDTELVSAEVLRAHRRAVRQEVLNRSEQDAQAAAEKAAAEAVLADGEQSATGRDSGERQPSLAAALRQSRLSGGAKSSPSIQVTATTDANHAAASAETYARSADVRETGETIRLDHRALAEAIVRRARTVPKNGSIEVRFALDPEELGPVRVRIESRGDQLKVRILASSSAAADAISAGVAKLTTQLSDAGIKDPDIDLSLMDQRDSAPEHRQNPSEARQGPTRNVRSESSGGHRHASAGRPAYRDATSQLDRMA